MARLTWRPGHDDDDVEGLVAVWQIDEQWGRPPLRTRSDAHDEVGGVHGGIQPAGQLLPQVEHGPAPEYE